MKLPSAMSTPILDITLHFEFVSTLHLPNLLCLSASSATVRHVIRDAICGEASRYGFTIIPMNSSPPFPNHLYNIDTHAIQFN